ncbi:MAG: hypothetical protein ACREN0_07265, partial [Thermodesulfobacteriota bacterium]
VVKHQEVYGRSEKDHWDRYLVTHTNTVFLVDRDGTLILTYPICSNPQTSLPILKSYCGNSKKSLKCK